MSPWAGEWVEWKRKSDAEEGLVVGRAAGQKETVIARAWCLDDNLARVYTSSSSSSSLIAAAADDSMLAVKKGKERGCKWKRKKNELDLLNEKILGH